MFATACRLSHGRSACLLLVPGLLLVLLGCARKFGAEDPILIGDGSLYIRTPGRKMKDHMFLGRIHHRNRRTVRTRFGRSPLPPQNQPCAGEACREEACDGCDIRVVYAEGKEHVGKTVQVIQYDYVLAKGLEIKTNGAAFSTYQADGEEAIFLRHAKIVSITVGMTSFADCGQPCEIRILAPGR